MLFVFITHSSCTRNSSLCQSCETCASTASRGKFSDIRRGDFSKVVKDLLPREHCGSEDHVDA